MTDVSLCFEVHQPLRLRKDFFWDGSPMRRVEPDQIFDFYFDDPENRRIFERVSEKCYLPANQIILEKISRYQDSERPFKTAYSFSGVFLDQCERYNPEVLESFARLVDTGMVEVLEQTYHHSLASLYEDGREFSEQVKMHRERIWDSFGVRPRIFENTELLYDDRIARIVEGMGYDGIFAEGVVAPPNHVYRPQGSERISLLPRTYLITHDLGVVAGMCDTVCVMYAGKIVEKAKTHDLYAKPSHPYTFGLIQSVPRLDKAQDGKLFSIEGQPPNVIDLPPCCPFHPRCHKVMDICRTQYPPTKDLGNGHEVSCWLFADKKGHSHE